MIKRPLCLAAVLILGIQMVLTGVFQMAEDLKPSPLERTAADGDKVILSGIVYKREERPKNQMLYLTDVQIRREEQLINESKILVYIKQNEIQKSNSQNSKSISVGNRVMLSGEVHFFENASNPGNFDQKFYYQKQGIHAAVWSEKAEITSGEVWRIQEGLTRLRIHWKNLLTEMLGEYYGNCMSAILLGDKSELDEEVKELYQKSGIGHILAISGLHMSFLGIGLYQLLRKTGISFLPAGTAGILFLFLYTLMVGSGVSSQRALVMFVVRVGADMAGRDYDLPTSLAVSAVIITLRQPLYLFDAGFLLSFGALTGIAVVYPTLDKLAVLPKMLRASVSIHIVLLPILLYYYFEISTYSLILNLLVIPLMSIVLGVGVFGSVIAVFWNGCGGMLLQICKLILWGYEQVAAFTVELPFGRIVLGQPEKRWCVVYYAILFLGCAMLRKMRNSNKMGHLKGGFVILYSIIFCLGCMMSHGKAGELRITAIDVGQGDSFYIRTPSGKHYLVDGGSTSESKVGKYRIEPFLKSQGVGILDYVFVSHGDADHINGIEELLLNQKMGIQVDTLVLPMKNVLDDNLVKLAETAEECGTRVVTMECGQQVVDSKQSVGLFYRMSDNEEMILTCLAPSWEYIGKIGNESSMVLELDYKEFEMLFTGDLEDEGEQMVIESGSLKDYDVLKTGHHGSKNSTSEELLEMIRPEIAVISAGQNNRYGHPHEETIERLEEHGSVIYSTQESGAVTVVTDGEEVQVKKYLHN